MSFGLIINHNLGSMNALSALSQNQNAISKVLQQLSTGKRINSAADDAAGLAISQQMQGQINGLQQASRNAQDGISLIQTAEGALNETENILQRMRQLAVQAANETNNADDLGSINQEITQLNNELDRIANTTQFNGQFLLNGSLNVNLQIDANTKDAGGSNASTILNIKLDAKSFGATGSGFDSTSLGTNGINITNNATAQSAIDSIDKAIKAVSTARTQLGAYQNRLEHTINNLNTEAQNLTAAQSAITDTDMASAMAEFTKDNVLQQAAISMLAQANQQPQLVLKLLG